MGVCESGWDRVRKGYLNMVYVGDKVGIEAISVGYT